MKPATKSDELLAAYLARSKEKAEQRAKRQARRSKHGVELVKVIERLIDPAPRAESDPERRHRRKASE